MSKDPYRAYRYAVTAFGNAREAMIWASAYGVDHEESINRKKKFELARVKLNRTVEKLIDKARKGEI